MRNTTLSALLSLAFVCTLVLFVPSPASAASSGLTVATAGSWSPMVLLSDLQDWWTVVVGSETGGTTVKGGLIMDPDGSPSSTTTSTTDFSTDPEREHVIDPDGAP